MPVLSNARHERFVQALFEGKPANAAYAEAGYRPHDGNCIRLRGNERIKARLTELQSEVARSSEITVESICKELDEANAVAREKGKANAMVSASALRAKLADLLTDKVKVSIDSNADDLDKPIELTCGHIAFERARLLLTGDDLEAFTDFMRESYQGWLDEVDHYLASLKAKPVDTIPADYERKQIGIVPSKQDYR